VSLTTAVGGLLPALDNAFPSSLMSVLRTFLEEHAEARSVRVYLADYDMLVLRPLDEENASTGPGGYPVDDSEPGRAFIAQVPTLEQRGDLVIVYVPISVRAERMGVLAVGLPAMPGADLLAGLGHAAVAMAYVLTSAGDYTDVIERARRERPLELPAEIQWTQLPVRAYSCPEFSVAGQLVPAYEVGGDLFDYALEPDELVVTVTDAMGHGINASTLGALAVGALRNARRTGLSLADQVRFADRVLYGQYGGDQFVTALAMSVRLDTGQAVLVNAGHPGLLRKRGDQISRIQLPAQLPMGMFEATRYREHAVTLQAGDRLVVVSDGVLEARGADGQPYGEQRLEGAILATATAPPSEAVRQLVRLLQEYQNGDLRDDATLLCLDWHGTG
jgi:serine phosphatase RsbU (regulator of sigma subunit)